MKRKNMHHVFFAKPGFAVKKFRGYGKVAALSLSLWLLNANSFAQSNEHAPTAADVTEYAKLTTSYVVDEFEEISGPVLNDQLIDVIRMSASIAVVAYRVSSTQVKMVSVKVNTNGTITVLDTYTYSEGVYGLKIQKMIGNRICIVNSKPSSPTGLKLKTYDVNLTTGSFSYLDSETAGFVSDMDVTVAEDGYGIVTTAVETYDGDIKLINWSLDTYGNITREGEAQIDNASVPRVVRSGPGEIVSGVRSSNGDMKLQLWKQEMVGGKLTPVLENTQTVSEEISDLALVKINNERFVAAIKQSNDSDNQKTLSYDSDGDDIDFNSSETNNDIAQVDATNLYSSGSGVVVTAARRKTSSNADKLYMQVYDVNSSGTIDRKAYEYGDKINQVRVDKLTTSRYITAYTRDSDSKLVIAAWDVSGLAPENPTATLEVENTNFTLGQSFPNPANGSATIPFQLNEAGWISLDVFDIAGKKVANVFAGNANAGKHQKQLSTHNLPTGIYTYKLQTRKGISVKKMSVTK